MGLPRMRPAHLRVSVPVCATAPPPSSLVPGRASRSANRSCAADRSSPGERRVRPTRSATRSNPMRRRDQTDHANGAPARERRRPRTDPGYQACTSSRRERASRSVPTCLPRLVARGCPASVRGVRPRGTRPPAGRCPCPLLYAGCPSDGRPAAASLRPFRSVVRRVVTAAHTRVRRRAAYQAIPATAAPTPTAVPAITGPAGVRRPDRRPRSDTGRVKTSTGHPRSRASLRSPRSLPQSS